MVMGIWLSFLRFIFKLFIFISLMDKYRINQGFLKGMIVIFMYTQQER